MDSTLIMLEILRSQIAELHSDLESNFLRQAVKTRVNVKNNRYKNGETRKVKITINVTCVAPDTQTLVVEELSRLLSLSLSLEKSLDNLSKLTVNGEEGIER